MSICKTERRVIGTTLQWPKTVVLAPPSPLEKLPPSWGFAKSRPAAQRPGGPAAWRPGVQVFCPTVNPRACTDLHRVWRAKRTAESLIRLQALAYGWSARNLNRPIRIQQAGKF